MKIELLAFTFDLVLFILQKFVIFCKARRLWARFVCAFQALSMTLISARDRAQRMAIVAGMARATGNMTSHMLPVLSLLGYWVLPWKYDTY